MKTNQLFCLLSLALACLTTNLYAAHATKKTRIQMHKIEVPPKVLPFQAAMARFEILSQDFADQQKNKSFNLPVVIRKEIDAFINELGRKPQEKDIEALRSQLMKKYVQPLTIAITEQLDAKREGSNATLRQLLQNNYGETTTNLAMRFAQDIIDLYISNGKRLSIHLQESPTDVQETVEHFAVNKNSLLVDLFDYKKIDATHFSQNIAQISSDGSFIQGGLSGRNIYQRRGDEYALQDTMQESIVGVSRDFSVIVTSAVCAFTGFSPELAVYVLNQETQKWSLAKTIKQENTKKPALSADGSTIVIINGNMVHSYLRQGSDWVELKPLIIPEAKENMRLEAFSEIGSAISPHGLTMVIKVQEQSRVRQRRGEPQPFSKRAIYQRRGNSWEEIDLPQGSIQFNTNDSLALVRRTTQATIWARNSNGWQQKQSFKGDAELFGDGQLIIIDNKDIYTQEPGYHWQKQQEFTTYKGVDLYNSSIKSSDDGNILVRNYNRPYDKPAVIETIIYARRGNDWHPAQIVPATLYGEISSNGLVIAKSADLYAIPAAALTAAESLQTDQWQLINDLYNSQAQGLVILKEEQRELFNTLPEIFQKAILSKWRVATGTETGVQYYQERQELKPNLSDEEMADYTELKNRELKELAQKLQGERKAQAATT